MKIYHIEVETDRLADQLVGELVSNIPGEFHPSYSFGNGHPVVIAETDDEPKMQELLASLADLIPVVQLITVENKQEVANAQQGESSGNGTRKSNRSVSGSGGVLSDKAAVIGDNVG